MEQYKAKGVEFSVVVKDNQVDHQGQAEDVTPAAVARLQSAAWRSRREFRCIAGCAGSYPLDQVIYRCPTCGDLLEVVHDLAALRARSAGEWKALFAERWRVASRSRGARGVWGKHEWVAPQLAPANIVSMLEGGTHLTPVPRFAAELGLGDVRVKQCGTSHSGSFKDLGMTVLVSMVKQMIARGQPIRAIACASTGDTSAALAAYAAAARHPRGRDPAARQDLDGAARPAARAGRARARDRHRLRRLHAPRAGARRPARASTSRTR